MRSKEVDKAIKTLTQYTFVGSKVTRLEACECIDIVLNYISELEEEVKDDKKVIEKILTENKLIG